jgi:hypothetical protein
MLNLMSRRIFYAVALLALLTTMIVSKLPAQESLGDAARRLRTKKDGGASTSTVDKTGSTQPGMAANTIAANTNVDVNATMTILAEHDEAGYSTRLRTQLEQERFKVLDDIAAAERTGRTRFPGGSWKLHAFYSAIESPKGKMPATEAEWADFLDQMKRWTAQQPDSITAQVAMAYAYLNYGLQTRGGKADPASATPDGQRLYDERIKLAETVLNQSYELPAKCPEWYYVMLQVGRAKGWEIEDLTTLFQRAIAFDPEYYYYYQEQALSLTPKWRGKAGDAEKFAEETANRGGSKAGNILYWEIAQYIVSNRALADMPQQFSWPRAQLGYQAMVEQYGTSAIRQNQHAQMAAKFGDYMVTDETLTQVGENWDQNTWGSREYFDKVKAWAKTSAVPFRKIIAAYQAVSVNIATPEGRKYDEVVSKEFSARYARAVRDCASSASGPAPTLLVLQMGKSGAVQQVMVVPETASDVCLRPKLEKAAFSPPPKPEYWVRVALSAKP